MQKSKVCILGGVRIPFCRVESQYAEVGVLELMTASLKGLVQRFDLEGRTLGEVALGAVIVPSRIWNFSRDAVIRSGLSLETPAVTLGRACGTSLEAASVIAAKIASGHIQVGVAGGADSMSDIPLTLKRSLARRILKTSRARTLTDQAKSWLGLWPTEFLPDAPAITESKTGLSMGEHCELMAQEWKISRQDQDALALQSHRNAHKAYERGFYKDLVLSFSGVERDNIVRGDTSLEKLSRLKPAFEFGEKGTLTAGNSSALTDGASCVLMASEEWAKQNGFEVQAEWIDGEAAAVDFSKEGLLMAPAYAVNRLLRRNNLQLQDFDFYEIHEAFAAQVLCTLRAWEDPTFCKERLRVDAPLGSIDRDRMNVCGGSVALGHPFGATGTRLVATLSKLLQEKGQGRGLISVCTGGGMGVTAILQRP